MRLQRHWWRIAYIALLWFPLFAEAQQYINKSIGDIAQEIWHKDKGVQGKHALKTSLLDVDNTPCYVVVRTDESERDTLPGYMLVAEENNSTVLLAFDQKGRFTSIDLPPHIKSWIKGYERMAPKTSEASRELQAWMKASHTSYDDVSPLLGQREWGQDNPYNLLCPEIDGKHCPSGCVATALSQIMSHHKWPLSGTGSISYTTYTKKIPINYDFSNTIFEWDKMSDTYVPVVDMSSKDDHITKNSRFYLNSIDVDNNSVESLKCYINVSALTVMGTSSFEGEVVLLATDESDNFISRVSSATSVSVHSSGRVLNNKSFLLYITSTMPDGTYRIYCAVRPNGSNDWSLSNTRGRANFITLSKDKDFFTAGGITFPCSPSTEDVMPVSSLLQAVGAAVRMDYNLGSSGSNNDYALEGLTTYLRYDSDMFVAEPDAYTDEQWHELLQKELTEGRPVYYTGQGLEAGHAFVIDGFKKAINGTAYYHVNWGWDGLCNGYYLLNMLRPSSAGTGGSSGSNYSNSPAMLIGMKPEDGISVIKMNCSSVDLLGADYFAGDFLPVRIRTLSLETSNDFTGKLRIELQREGDGQNPISLYESDCTITSKRAFSNYFAPCQIPLSVSGGVYTLKLSCTTRNGEDVEIRCKEWPQISIKDANEWTGGPMTQSLKKLAVGGSCAVLGQEEAGWVTLSIDSVVNPMPLSTNGQLALLLCDKNGRMLVEPEETVPISVSGYNVRRNIRISSPISRYMPDGNYELCIGYLTWNDPLWTFCNKIHCENTVWWSSYSPFGIPMSIRGGRISILNTEFEGADIPWVNGIHNLMSDTHHTDVIYDLSGRRTKGRQKGLYIIRKNNKSDKIIK